LTVTLVLGGARSGKSAYAHGAVEVAAAEGRTPVMIATAEALDAEMAERIQRHRAERGERWRTVEAPVDLAEAIAALGAGDAAAVDCLTLWLSNLMLRELDVERAADGLLSALAASPAELWVVSNEVGMGIVPENALARRFRDEAGRLNRRVAAQADRVIAVMAGLPLTLK
jgi:adenosylcobinamide kinase/adenosylcobinamide-phosphate guanylyltransferase